MEINEEECGLRKETGCSEQIVVVRHLCKKKKGSEKAAYLASMNLEKPNDTFNNKALE